MTEFAAALPSSGTFSVWHGPVAGDPWFVHNEHERHYAASTMKLALVMAAFAADGRGAIDLDGLVEVRNDFRSAADGSAFAMDPAYDSDPQPWLRVGGSVSLRWLAYRAIVRSSNLATNLLLDSVGTRAIGQLLTDVGATGSIVQRGIEDGAARAAGLDNLVTAADLALELQALHRGKLLGDAASQELISVLRAQQVNDAIPAGLPSGTAIGHKSGWVDGVVHDAAIVDVGSDRPFVLVVCTTSALAKSEATGLIADAARAAWADRGRAAQ